jgi:hypothetical protein
MEDAEVNTLVFFLLLEHIQIRVLLLYLYFIPLDLDNQKNTVDFIGFYGIIKNIDWV